MRRFLLIACLGALAGAPTAQAQTAAPAAPATRYWVALADKNGTAFDPQAYFSAPARARRARQHLPAFEESDRPVRADYLARIRAAVDTVTLISRWFNAVAVRATPAQAAALGALPGVRAVAAWPQQPARAAVAARRVAPVPPAAAADEPPYIAPEDYRLARRQTAVLGAPAWQRAGLDGRGLRIALFDVGFRGVDAHPAFAALRARHGIVATHDFLANRPDVYRGGSHGTEVLGCLAGRLPGGPSAALAAGPALGLAPAADYLLARTERALRETLSEEEAWLAAAEWADREGADIINSSLAYTEQRYFPEQMNGRSLVARAAALAAHKGMLVVCAAGNDGDTDWVRIGTPADADSVLAVGGLDPDTGLHLAFSSVGPSADRRVKPDVSAFGIVLSTTPGGRYERLEGTSFASPLVAGFAACAWQQRRGLTAAQLYGQLRAAGDLHPYFDYASGYGLPRAAFFLEKNAGRAVEPTFDFVPNDSLVAVVLRPAATTRPAQELPLVADAPDAPDAPGPPPPSAPAPSPGPGPNSPPYLYWHLADRRGVLRRYEVRAVTQRLVLQVPRRLLRGGDALRVEFNGYTATYSE
ncbi:S8 family serine peptidase [Hymenobacter nivis]|uniref:S8 family serine peptidase n=1 Tax=Hymenobacter nivis TaxID=1850093 RepID=UPI00112A94BA|nr:S8 family serine peptidase [Hymenobacter nivis]